MSSFNALIRARAFKALLAAFVTAVALICAASFEAAALEPFTITSYDIVMDVRDDNSYAITETLDVTFTEARHGIIRSIPMRTYNGYATQIYDISVDGHEYKFSHNNGDYEIKIGSESALASENERYVVHYTYLIGDDRLSDMDEVYFNLVGADWDNYIDRVTFAVHMPKSFDPSWLNFTAGYYGSESSDGVDYKVEGNSIYGSCERRLSPYEALTMALPLPQGYFSSAPLVDTATDTLTNVLKGFYWLIIPLLGAVGLLIWAMLGKNRRIFPTVEFYPPANTTPADVGFIIDGRVDPMDVTSLIVYWAGKGYLSIEEIDEGKNSEYILHKISDIGDDAKEYEKLMFNKLFDTYGDGHSVEVVTLKNKFYTTVSKVRKMVVDGYEKNEKTRIFERSGEWSAFLLGIISFLVFLPFVMVALHSVEPSQPAFVYVAGVLVAIVLSSVQGAFVGMITQFKSLSRKKRITSAISRTLIALILFFGCVSVSAHYNILAFCLVTYAVGTAMLVLCRNSKRRTKMGDWFHERLQGFRSFLMSAERDRINELVHDHPNYFYDILPYAMVLSVTDEWIRNFEDIALPPPDWYSSGRYHSSGFVTAVFVHDLNRGISRMSASMASSPSSGSGGSSGGGRSGGGSGGGGGRSW